ncbi:hypothetical protein Tam10B_2115 [Bifidobacterium vansinderenii]|uniref:Uncharacterized protein n=1 Tax=Bifidobacterium vansinderenii TaxID=1984871 RepID=A0A229VVJ6_9BIFI|nr:hypothetical protein Tam10B_2115 [Bifidobacterium vansinderenii]
MAVQAAMALQVEFDEFVDAIRVLPPDTDRQTFTRMVEERYEYDDDIESEELLHTLAIRAARHLAEDEFSLWIDEESILGTDPVRALSDRLTAWATDDRSADGDQDIDTEQSDDAASAAFQSSRDDRFRKACWTLIRTARSKCLRLTVPVSTGRVVGPQLLAGHIADEIADPTEEGDWDLRVVFAVGYGIPDDVFDELRDDAAT